MQLICGEFAPQDHHEGQIWFNTATEKFMMFHDDVWVTVDAIPSEFNRLPDVTPEPTLQDLIDELFP